MIFGSLSKYFRTPQWLVCFRSGDLEISEGVLALISNFLKRKLNLRCMGVFYRNLCLICFRTGDTIISEGVLYLVSRFFKLNLRLRCMGTFYWYLCLRCWLRVEACLQSACLFVGTIRLPAEVVGVLGRCRGFGSVFCGVRSTASPGSSYGFPADLRRSAVHTFSAIYFPGVAAVFFFCIGVSYVFFNSNDLLLLQQQPPTFSSAATIFSSVTSIGLRFLRQRRSTSSAAAALDVFGVGCVGMACLNPVFYVEKFARLR